MPLQSIFCIIPLNISRAELRTDSVLLSLNSEIAKRAKRAKIFGRLTQKTYVNILRTKRKKTKNCRGYGLYRGQHTLCRNHLDYPMK